MLTCEPFVFNSSFVQISVQCLTFVPRQKAQLATLLYTPLCTMYTQQRFHFPRSAYIYVQITYMYMCIPTVDEHMQLKGHQGLGQSTPSKLNTIHLHTLSLLPPLPFTTNLNVRAMKSIILNVISPTLLLASQKKRRHLTSHNANVPANNTPYSKRAASYHRVTAGHDITSHQCCLR